MNMKIRILFMLLLIGMAAFNVFGMDDKIRTPRNVKAEEGAKSEPLKIQVVLKRIYLDGEISEEMREETVWAMEDLWAQYKDWKLVNMGLDGIIFEKKIDDISPLLKTNGYFGITENGILSIFNGKPGKENIIQSFFQIDIDKLESHRQMELKEGIPIKTKDHYIQVLESLQSLKKES
jgi:forespore regulator of the sigma-K checkpoint